MEREQILTEIISTQSLPDYEAFDTLWAAMTKAANLVQGESECQRMESLFERLSKEEIKRLLKDGSVDSLIFLDPPLETVIVDPDEKPVEDSTMRIIAKVRSSRDSDPGEALINLVEILGRINDTCVHGLKTESGSRDNEILSSARKILYLLCILAISKLN
ncbi:MAG: hypothetical protein ACUZ8N_00760 [Candidatus Scalindua sp.]